MKKRDLSPAFLISTLGPVGYLPFFPGTWGSAVAVVVWWVCFASQPPYYLWTAIFLLFIVGTWTAGRTEKSLGHDAGQIVVDEVVGQWLVLIVCGLVWWQALLSFLLFRIFDVLKPFPVGISQRLPGGLGVMIDDVLAGGYAITAFILIRWVIAI